MWPLPVSAPDNIRSFCLVLPSHGEWTKIVRGALAQILRPINYNQDTTGLDIDEVIEYAQEIFDSMSVCFTLNPGDVFASFRGYTDGTALLCDGALYDIADYPLLSQALVGITYHDATQFRVPDMRGRAVIGSGQGSGLSNRVLNATGGEETHQLTVSEIPSHNHSTHSHISSIAQLGAGSAVTTPGILGENTGSTGGDGSHENMPPFVVLNYYIVTGE